MGSFVGHAIPGSFFMLFGFWWCTQLPRRRLLCQEKQIQYLSTVTFPVPTERLSKWPIEAFVKIFVSFAGVVVEALGSTHLGQLDHMASVKYLQHMTMYGGLLVSGVFDCFQYRGWNILPKGTDYLALSMALVGEYVLFSHHLMGRNGIDILVHTLALYVLQAGFLVVIVEHFCRHNELLTFLRIYSAFLQGTWFYQIAFILYPPGAATAWEDGNHEHTMAVAVAFVWHAGVDLVLMGALYAGCLICYKSCQGITNLSLEYEMISQGETLKRLPGRRRTGTSSAYLNGK